MGAFKQTSENPHTFQLLALPDFFVSLDQAERVKPKWLQVRREGPFLSTGGRDFDLAALFGLQLIGFGSSFACSWF
jgi:hypothetical protein